MHNVLNCYSKQLRQNRSPQKANGSRDGDLGSLRPESVGKREATLAAISDDIFKRLTDVDCLNAAKETAAEEIAQRPAPNGRCSPEPEAGQFVFNSIDRLNRKKINRLSVEDSKGFVKRIEEMAREAVESQIESWV